MVLVLHLYSCPECGDTTTFYAMEYDHPKFLDFALSQAVGKYCAQCRVLRNKHAEKNIDHIYTCGQCHELNKCSVILHKNKHVDDRMISAMREKPCVDCATKELTKDFLD